MYFLGVIIVFFLGLLLGYWRRKWVGAVIIILLFIVSSDVEGLLEWAIGFNVLFLVGLILSEAVDSVIAVVVMPEGPEEIVPKENE